LNTLTQTQAGAPAWAERTFGSSVTIPWIGMIPIQTGPVYHCFTCGAVAQGLRTWADLPKWDGYSHPDAWGEHIAYLVLPACPASHIHRVAKLGECVTPLTFVQHTARGEWHKTVAANIQAIRDALAALAAAVPESERSASHDPAASIVLSLLAGLMTPAAAMDQIRQLLESRNSEEVPVHA
jgi:hypothetical protein